MGEEIRPGVEDPELVSGVGKLDEGMMHPEGQGPGVGGDHAEEHPGIRAGQGEEDVDFGVMREVAGRGQVDRRPGFIHPELALVRDGRSIRRDSWRRGGEKPSHRPEDGRLPRPAMSNPQMTDWTKESSTLRRTSASSVSARKPLVRLDQKDARAGFPETDDLLPAERGPVEADVVAAEPIRKRGIIEEFGRRACRFPARVSRPFRLYKSGTIPGSFRNRGPVGDRKE